MNPSTSYLPLTDSRHHSIYLAISAIFISTLCLINVMNISRFVTIDFSFWQYNLFVTLPIGVLPYPLTFLCTDIISECYGKQAANRLVTAGLIANLAMLVLFWLCGLPAPFIPDASIATQTNPESHFYYIRFLTMTAIISSMLAYLVAQYLDVHIFHFLKDLTKNKHLWLRNNVSTFISQFVDTCLVLTCTYFMTRHLAWGESDTSQFSLVTVILSSYGFKFFAALLDTIPCYFFVWLIKKKTAISPQLRFKTAHLN